MSDLPGHDLHLLTSPTVRISRNTRSYPNGEGSGENLMVGSLLHSRQPESDEDHHWTCIREYSEALGYSVRLIRIHSPVLAMERERTCQLLHQPCPRGESSRRTQPDGPLTYPGSFQDAGISRTSTKTLINACLQIFNLIMAFTSALYVDQIGRRKLFLISNTGMILGRFDRVRSEF